MAAATQTREVVALSAIIWSYFDRLAEGDPAKAAAVLSNFQGLYSASSASVRSTASAAGFSLPATLPASGAWNANTRLVAQVVLAASVEPGTDTDAYIGVLENMPNTSQELPAWFTELQRTAPSNELVRSMLTLVRGTNISALTTKLTQVYSEFVAGAAPAASGSVNFGYDPFKQSAVSRASTAVTQLADELLVTGSHVRTQMPLWGWVAIGTGVVVAGGVLVWGLVKKKKRS